jgi:hypothetical protein
MPFMRSMLVLTLLVPLGATATAQVVRCEDAAGNVSYNDTGCKAGARRSELVFPPEATRQSAPSSPPSSPYVPYVPNVPYAPYPHGDVRRRQDAQPQDMRPRIRSCGPSGCQDTQGNHYDRSGKLDRYVRPDGRTCRPVGTTVICQ